MQNVRKDIVKAIKDANEVIKRLDAEARELAEKDITETEFDYGIDCINCERALVHRVISKLYDVLGNIPAR